MTYYDRIQQAIDYIEEHLEADFDQTITIDTIATKAWMSTATFYRLFFALTGHTIKHYIRKRQINEAIVRLRNSDDTILSVATTYGFSSHEAFTRACKRLVGATPSVLRNNTTNSPYKFERMNIMTTHTEAQSPHFQEKYPDIKVIKTLTPFEVASFKYFGTNPEDGAFEGMINWLKKQALNIETQGLRVFGFDNPSPQSQEDAAYGYEVWVTLPPSFEKDASCLTLAEACNVTFKTTTGGLYAVCGIKDLVPGGDGKEIMAAWKRLNAWLKESAYNLGTHQWMEEHLSFNEEFEHISGMDLYMPIIKK